MNSIGMWVLIVFVVYTFSTVGVLVVILMAIRSEVKKTEAIRDDVGVIVDNFNPGRSKNANKR